MFFKVIGLFVKILILNSLKANARYGYSDIVKKVSQFMLGESFKILQVIEDTICKRCQREWIDYFLSSMIMLLVTKMPLGWDTGILLLILMIAVNF